MAHRPDTPRPLGLAAALVPVAALVVLLGLSFFLFGDAAAAGPNQVALVFCAIVATFVAWRHGHTIEALRDAAVASVTTGLSAIFILLAVGALIGTWALSGTLIAMVYYGLQLLNPDYFYMTACLICAVVAVSIGSSWTVAGTIGIGLMGVAQKMGLDPAITAGAIISGAYFGDKSSPLSDTANLACAAAGANLYDHVARVALDLGAGAPRRRWRCFWCLGSPVDFDASAITARIEAAFHPSLAALPAARPRARAGAAALAALRHHLPRRARRRRARRRRPPRSGSSPSPGRSCPPGLALLKGVWAALATGYVSTTGEPAVDQLLTRGGMASMLGTVWLILVALAFGGIVEKAGVLDRLIGPVIAAARSVGALVATLVGAAFATNVLASDQYIAVVLPGRMFRGAFAERGLAPVVLSRALGDFGDRDLAAHPLEQLRRLHGRDPRRRRHLLRPLRLLQPAEPARLDRLRLPRASGCCGRRRRTLDTTGRKADQP